jgi:hypothetical protein
MEHGKITLRHELISPQQALHVVTHELYERQRPLDQNVVEQYALAMRQQEFRPGTVVSFCLWNNRRYLINGQHTHHGIVRAETPLLLGIEEIEVKSYADIAAWYIKYDRIHVRTLRQMYKAVGLSEALNLNDSQSTELCACLPLLAAGFMQVTKTRGWLTRLKKDAQIRMTFGQEWVGEVTRFFENIKGAPGKIAANLRCSAIMSVALVTYRYTGTDAEEFWKNVAFDDGLANNDPCHRLHLFVFSTKTSSLDAHVYSRYVAAAWNLAFHNKSIVHLRPMDAATPIEIAGTPHTGAEVLRYVTEEGKVLHDPTPAV